MRIIKGALGAIMGSQVQRIADENGCIWFTIDNNPPMVNLGTWWVPTYYIEYRYLMSKGSGCAITGDHNDELKCPTFSSFKPKNDVDDRSCPFQCTIWTFTPDLPMDPFTFETDNFHLHFAVLICKQTWRSFIHEICILIQNHCATLIAVLGRLVTVRRGS